MLRNAKQLQIERSAFAVCPQDKLAVRGWIEAAQDKAKDADNASVSKNTRALNVPKPICVTQRLHSMSSQRLP
jgi:hypothetical protein